MLFRNGSEIVFIGLQDANKRRGVECDVFVLNEGTLEKTSHVWATMGATLAGGRRGGFYVDGKRFSQMITDTNPSHKYHWIYQHFKGKNKEQIGEEQEWLTWTHHDNPALVDRSTRELNENGRQVLADLKRTYGDGYEALRMIHGIWCSAEGTVYSMWNPDIHEMMMRRSDFPPGTKWHVGIDHGGGQSPFAVGIFAEKDKCFYLFKEIVMSQTTIATVIQKLDQTLADHDIDKSDIDTGWGDTASPAFNLALRDAGYPMMLDDTPVKDVLGRIDTVKGVIRDNRLFVNKSSLEERCGHYKGPQGWAEEITAYSYLPEDQQRIPANADKPIKEYDHAMDMAGYVLYGLKEKQKINRQTGFVARF